MCGSGAAVAHRVGRGSAALSAVRPARGRARVGCFIISEALGAAAEWLTWPPRARVRCNFVRKPTILRPRPPPSMGYTSRGRWASLQSATAQDSPPHCFFIGFGHYGGPRVRGVSNPEVSTEASGYSRL